jgi:hypothetical protein
MLKENLDFLWIRGKRMEGPQSLSELQSDYFHAGRLTAKANNGYDPSQDIGKILTLRPDASPYYCTKRPKPINRGYFAYSRKEGDNVVFEIFSPYSGVKSRFPPKSLELAVALLAVTLTDAGYEIPAHSIEYSTRIE